MANAKKFLITTVSSEIFIKRTAGSGGSRAFCSGCRTDTEMLTLDQTVSLFGVKTRELIRMAEAGEIHADETHGGHLLICSESLRNESTLKTRKKW